MSLRNIAAKAALPALAAVSYYCTWGLSERNDHFQKLREIRNSISPMLPDTNAPVRQTYTGFGPLDELLAILVMSFWPVVDGRSPHVSLYAFQFAGQFMPLCVILLLEERRRGNRWRLVSFTTIWTLVGQAWGFTNLMPIYCLLHLFTSPTSGTGVASPNTPATDLLVYPTDLYVLPISMVLGFVVPTILIALPSPQFSSYDTHQMLMSLWQLFPAVVAVLQFVFSNVLSIFLPFEPQYRSAAERNARTLSALRLVYLFGFAVSAVTHIAAWTISLSSVILPTLLNVGLVPFLDPTRVFLPPRADMLRPVETIGDGMLYFLQYDQYLGFLSTIIWAATLLANAYQEGLRDRSWIGRVMKILSLTVVAGPGSAALALIWERDEFVIGCET